MWAVRKLRAEPGLDLVEVPVPTIADDEVLVRVEAASICGTDLHIYKWDDWAQRRITPPLTLGHEFAGTVVATGAFVRQTKVGDYVSAESHVTCGVCINCRTGRAHMCEFTEILGVERDGAFAEFVAIPESVVWQNDRVKLPPEIATLQEPFGNAVFALSHADLAGKTVAILGCGPVGLFSVGIASVSGAGRVIASDTRPFRLDLARTMLVVERHIGERALGHQDPLGLVLAVHPRLDMHRDRSGADANKLGVKTHHVADLDRLAERHGSRSTPGCPRQHLPRRRR